MRNSRTETEPAGVPVGATQAGEIQGRWPWVEPSVWTERMLTALEEGVKGGKWYSLIDKVSSLRNLRSAFAQVKRNKGGAGVDRVTIRMFEAHLEENLQRLSDSLREGSYRPQAIRRVWIPKPGSREKRPLGIPTVRDRVVQTALRNVLEPIFERDFAAQSYGFRPERSTKDALRRVAELLKAGYVHVVDADLQSYYDTIPRQPLLGQVRGKVADSKVLELLEGYLAQDVMEGVQHWTPERGTPQGAVISPLLSNVYLDPLDHHMAQRGYEMVRYADDFVILCRSQLEAQRALAEVEEWTTAAGLRLHPEKTRIVDATQRGGFDFLGYHFERGHRWPSKKSLGKLKDKIRAKTRRTSGHSLQRVVSELVPIQRGWCEYFKHSRRFIFLSLDKWIRMRLRSILRHRQKRKGRGRGKDHNRWPNAFFAEQGLFSFTAAYAQARQSSRR
jgi:RNA-directed DNA polymerase